MVNDVYDIIKDNLDSHGMITEEYIIQIVGIYGLSILHQHDLLENRGLIKGHQSYSLRKK